MSDGTAEAVSACAGEYVLVAQRAWARGLVAGTGGNMSVRVPGQGRVLIKPSGVSNVECRDDTLLQVALDGTVLVGSEAPTRDLNFHLAIYQARPDVGGIVHAHVPWATSLTFLGNRELPLLTPHAHHKLGRVPIVGYFDSGTNELRDLVADAFANATTRAVLLERHGMIAVGPTLTAAEEIAELVEETAQIAVLVRLGQNTRPEGEQ